MKLAAPRLTMMRICVLRFGMGPRGLRTAILALQLLYAMQKRVHSLWSGVLQTAIGDCRATRGAPRRATTKTKAAPQPTNILACSTCARPPRKFLLNITPNVRRYAFQLGEIFQVAQR